MKKTTLIVVFLLGAAGASAGAKAARVPATTIEHLKSKDTGVRMRAFESLTEAQLSAAQGNNAQRPGAKRRTLTQQQRIGLINSVLAERHQLFGQTVILGACQLAKAVGDSVRDPRSFLLDSTFRRNVRGNASDCGRPEGFVPNRQTVVVEFSEFRNERTEWVDPGPEFRVSHPADLVVVRLTVHSSVLLLTHVEEWVMSNTVGNNWRALNVRVLHISTG